MGKVSVSELEALYELYNENKTVYLHFGRGENSFEVEVKRRLNADEAMDIVTYVCNKVVNPETGDYNPELKDYFLRVAVLKTYTNLMLPEDKRCWDFVYGTPIFAKITGNERRPVIFGNWDYGCDDAVIDVEQYEQIVTAIDQLIDYTVRCGY